MAESETETPANAVTENETTAAAPSTTEDETTQPESVVETNTRTGGPLAAFEAVSRSARLADLVAIARAIISEAAKARRTEWNFVAKVAAAADDAKLPRADVETPFGNALKVLGSGPDDEAERALACALAAHAVVGARRDEDDRTASDVLWLATHSPFDATSLLDRALGADADHLWIAIADRVKRVLVGKGAALRRAEIIVACAALTSATSSRARALSRELVTSTKDPVLVRILTGVEDIPEVRLEGEVMPVPRGPIATTLLALSGVLFVIHGARLFARLALGYERPAELVVSARGVRLHARTRMLGRTLRDREHVIVRAGLLRVVREVRYPRAAFYAGLLALAFGSWLGVRALMDGVRAASPSLLLAGLAIIALGIAADFVLGSLLPGTRGRCRIAFVPRVGRTLCIGNVDAKRADEALASTLRP
ncbi:MAG: hypothetical protein FWD69_06370 [Polyangiaceae bacterium]|nr:hypothetical protein [Polyangiaceae bacterium]